MSSKEHAERLSKVLENTGLVEPVRHVFAENRVNVLCRVTENTEKRWVELLRNILVAEQEELTQAHAWQCHFCKHYFLKDVDGTPKMVWGWNISIFSQNMSASLDAICMVIKGVPIRVKVQGELTEFPLAGASPGTPNEKGRGAHKLEEFRPSVGRR